MQDVLGLKASSVTNFLRLTVFLSMTLAQTLQAQVPLWTPVVTSNGSTIMVEVEAPPSAPQQVQVPDVSNDDDITVDWDAVGGATFYQVEQYSTTDGLWHTVHTTTHTSWNSTNLNSGTYLYRVKACNASGCGTPSAAGQVLVSIPIDSVPAFSQPAHDASVGATASSHEVSTDGGANYSIPITVPSGKGGVQPQLTVNYNSNAGNGLMGIGWSLGGLSAIHRCAKTFVQDGVVDGVDLDGTDKYCMDGQRLVVVSGTYGANGSEYRTENDTFSKIMSYGTSGDGPSYFKVWSKDGKVFEYGASSDSRIEAQGKSHVTIWALNRVEDAYSNYMQVNYTEDSAGGYRPLSIVYTGNADAGLSPYYSVIFEYENRYDSIPEFLQGSVTSSPVRLSHIKTYHLSTEIRHYQFDYYDLPLTNISRLDTITECVAGVCFNPTQTFYESGNNDGQYLSGNYNALVSSGYGDYWQMAAGDVNGDGLVDKVAYYIGSSSGQGIHLRPLLSNGDGTYTASTYSTPASSGYAGSSWKMTTGDVNGDGLTDMIAYFIGHSNSEGVRIVAYTSNGDGTFGTGTYNNPSATGYATGWEMVAGDANGDGRTDMIAYYVGSNESNGLHVVPFLSNGDTHSTFTAGTYNTIASTGYASGWKVAPADANGDGLTDMVAYYIGQNNGIHIRPVFSEGNGVYVGGTYSAIEATGYGDGWQMIPTDANGDGLTDMTAFYIGKGDGLHLRTLLSKGDGTYTAGIYKTIASSGYGTGWNITSSDSNGDGYGDVIAYYIGQNNGSQVLPLLSKGTGDYAAGQLNVLVTSGYNSGWGMMPSDTDGDGLAEMVAFYIGSANADGVHLVPYLSKAASPEKLTAITNGFDSKVSFEYELLTQTSAYTKGSGAVYPIIDAKGPQCVVTKKTVSNGLGGEFTTSYQYGGLKLHSRGLGSLGFSNMRTLNEETGTYTYTYFNQNVAAKTHGSVDRITSIANNGTVLSDTVNDWSTLTVSGGDITRYRRQLTSTEVTKRDLNGAFLHKETTAYLYDDFDNIATINSVVYDGANNAIRTTNTTNGYRNDTSYWLLGLLEDTTVTVTAYADTQIRKSAWTYDYATGKKLTESILDPSSNIALNTTTYSNIDYFGNHLTTTVSGPDFATRASSVVYDSSGRFVTSATNALGHTASSTYYPDSHINAGLLETSTDINGQITHHSYDVMGRKTQTIAAYGSASQVASYTSFQWCDDVYGLCPSRATYAITTSSADGSASRVFIDKLGREVRRSGRGLNGRFAHVDSEYNELGHNTLQSEPYFDGDQRFVMSLQYDVLGRVIQSTNADGSVDTITFNGLIRTSRNDVNGANQQKIEQRDVLGNITRVTDNAGYSINYTYDASGNMLSVVDPVFNTTTIQYDALGRKQSMNDPDKGLWSYTYNGLGELLTQTNAKGVTTCTAYDALGRMVARVDNYQGNLPNGLGQSSDAGNNCANSGPSSKTANWLYDNAPGRGLGQLHAVTNNVDYLESYQYDSYGRVTEVEQVVDSSSYVITTQYDALHRPEIVTYPGVSNRLQVKTVYNNAGFPIEIKNAANDMIYHQVTAVNARGNTVSENLGNGLSTHRVYNAATGRIEGIGTFRPLDYDTPGVQQLEFGFDVIGNLNYRRDHSQNITENFTYDNLNRLRTTTSDFGNGDTRFAEVTYDVLGNILTKTGVGSYSYGGTTCGRQAGPHAVTAISSPKATTYCYDANGNMISGDGRTIQYSYFDKPTHITKGGHSTQIKYGPGRSRYQRIDQQGSNTTTYTYVGGLYEKVNKPNGTIEERHFVGDSVVVTISDRSANAAGTVKTRYLHKDHIGSTTVITDELMNIVEEFSFDAWGKRRAPSLAKLEQLLAKPWASMTTLEQGNLTVAPWLLVSNITNKGFTGHEQLDGVGLIHMNGRVYDAELGRFLSADPFVQDRTNLQGLNRYSYVENNPLSYTDPSGYFLKKVFKKLKKLVKKVFKGIRTGLKSIFQGIGRVLNAVPGLSTVVGIVISIINPAAGALYFKILAGLNAAVSLANGASIGDVATGFAVGMVASGLGGALGNTLSKGIGVAGHYVAGGLAGGAAAKAMGGSFKDGVAGGLLGAAARHSMGEFSKEPVNSDSAASKTGGLKDEAYSVTKSGEKTDSFSAGSQARKLENALDIFKKGLEADGDQAELDRFSSWDVISDLATPKLADGSMLEATTSFSGQYTRFYGWIRGMRSSELVKLVAHEFRHLSPKNHALNSNRSFLGNSWAERPVEIDAGMWANSFMRRNREVMFGE